MSELPVSYATTPDPDDQPNPEPVSDPEPCNVPSHWEQMVTSEALVRDLRYQVAELAAQIGQLDTGLCHDSRHHNLEADLMRANGEVEIQRGELRRMRQAGATDGGAF